MTLLAVAAALLIVGVPPQTAPARPAGDVTGDLNSRPPTLEEYLARTAPPPAAAPAIRPAAPPPAAAARPAPANLTPASPSPASPSPASPVTPALAAETPPPPSVPAVAVLDAAARAALPFTVDLPAGFQLVTGRPGPDFRIYTVRRGDRSFAMIYAGPASQFPIYSGETVEAGGRVSVVSTEGGVRHAREHLFLRDGVTPREVHVWTMSLDGPDRVLAERIAQSVDVR